MQLKTTDYVLLLRGPKRNSLQMPYNGTISREEKHFTIKMTEKEVIVSIDRLNPVYVIKDILPEDNDKTHYRIELQIPDPG